ncbi:hypothetical protein Fmac_018566 [Flemingia macrophylla]|uniref:Uncharacterized protein n=1 Tax=Flemingia macrophylla TaxID=520843 RepID=A0ABD1M5G0_9FABA
MQQLQLMQQRSAQLQRRDPNHPALGGSINAMNSEGMLGLSPASVMAMKIQFVHGNSGNMSTALQQIPGRTPLTADIKGEVNLGAAPKSLPIDTSVLQSKSWLGSTGELLEICVLPVLLFLFYFSSLSLSLSLSIFQSAASYGPCSLW